jgi:hypothetical protein
MPIVMIRNAVGINDPDGNTTKNYLSGEVLNTDIEWINKLAQRFIEQGAAVEAQAELNLQETKKKTRKKKIENEDA